MHGGSDNPLPLTLCKHFDNERVRMQNTHISDTKLYGNKQKHRSASLSFSYTCPICSTLINANEFQCICQSNFVFCGPYLPQKWQKEVEMKYVVNFILKCNSSFISTVQAKLHWRLYCKSLWLRIVQQGRKAVPAGHPPDKVKNIRGHRGKRYTTLIMKIRK